MAARRKARNHRQQNVNKHLVCGKTLRNATKLTPVMRDNETLSEAPPEEEKAAPVEIVPANVEQPGCAATPAAASAPSIKIETPPNGPLSIERLRLDPAKCLGSSLAPDIQTKPGEIAAFRLENNTKETRAPPITSPRRPSRKAA
ncbi:MAG: hypothetical protein R3C54_01120 [Parvularculaceae bacterium]